MTKRAHNEPPRLMSEAETAHRLAMSPSEFSRRSRSLEDELGMPRRHPILKRRDRIAIDEWLNAQFGVDQKPASLSALVRSRMRALGDGKSAN